MAAEAVRSLEKSDTEPAALIQKFTSHLVVDRETDELVLFNCDRAIARTLQLQKIITVRPVV
jgi:hypothetical protein